MEKPKILLVWYKRDLRITDHAPLTAAVELGKEKDIPVMALYSFEPRITNAPDFSNFHRQFIESSLTELASLLKARNIPLIIFERPISDAMKNILEHYQIEQIFSHEETGNAISYERDIQMKKYLKAKQIPWGEFPTNGVVRRLKSRDDWSRIWNARMTAPLLPPPPCQKAFASRIFSDAWERNLQNPRIQPGGETEWKKVLDSFLLARGKRYMWGMSRPIDGQNASSRISPYLAYGCISLKQVVQMTWIRMGELKTSGDAKFLRSLQAFHSRLHWQSHFIQKLESEPKFENENAFALYDTIRNTYDESIMSAIESAQTGIPFIDGIIRQLQATGWVNFRARATLVSFVCCTCMQPWQGRFSHWLARLFTDYEPGIHYPQIQMQSGTMGVTTLRIYNPVKQLEDKDTDGRLVATWLPELARLPKYLQAEPWKISDMESIEYGFVLGRDYPHPLVDVEQANKKSREILYGMKKLLSPESKKSLLEKHGSRKKNYKKKASQKKTHTVASDNLSLFD